MREVTAFDHDLLVAALHERGVCYLAPTPTGDEPSLSDDELILGLASSADGRLRFALAALLLKQPQLAANVSALANSHSAANAILKDELRKQYAAAMYLQRMWRTRLRFALGESALIPEQFTRELDLPPADDMYGERGLHELADRSRFNDWSSYEQVIEMLCDQPCMAQTVSSVGGQA